MLEMVGPAFKRQGLIVRCASPRCPHGLLVEYGDHCFEGPEWANKRFGEDGWAVAYMEPETWRQAREARTAQGVWAAYCWHHKNKAAKSVTGQRSQPFALRCGWPGCEYLMLLPWGVLPHEYALNRKIPAPMFFQYVRVRTSPLTRPRPATAMLCPTHGMPGEDDSLAPTNRLLDA